jgi:pimeloyl-ACP methyl ester carboxylesterase
MDHGRGALLAQLEPYAGEGMAAVHEAMESIQPPDPPLPADLAAFMRERFVASTVAGFFGMSAAIGGEPDRSDALRDAGVPTLVCFGERDTGWPLAQQREMAGRLGAQLTVIAEAGHSPALDRPTQTTAALTAFWATHTTGVPGTL